VSTAGGNAPAEACRDLCAAALEEARGAWGLAGLPVDRFAERAAAVAAGRLARSGVEATADEVRATLGRSALADLALAVACEDRVEGAWEALASRLAPRLEGLARRRGVSGDDAAALAQDVLSEWALPARVGAPRSLLSTYEGAGSLFGWAAVILSRRVSRARRREAGREGGGDAARGDEPVERRRPTPLEAAQGREALRRVEAALTSAWASLSGRERLALAWRHADGLPQTRIAGLLRVSEPHTSRILAGAVARLRDAARAALGEDAPPLAWPAVAESVRRILVSPGSSAPLPLEDPGRAGASS
jgi:RNA polymerase sigma factor (sigma-70 family)